MEHSTVFPYDRAEHETVRCNLCDGADSELLVRRDRNGLAVSTVICTNCGLIYLSPRMTPAWYERYYVEEYRRQMARFRGKTLSGSNPQTVFSRQLRHGKALAAYIDRHSTTARKRILEIGSSAGGVLRSLGDYFQASVLGVEPCAAEAAFATQHGIPTQVDTFENARFGESDRFDLIVCTQVLNHLHDPLGVVAKAAGLLAPDGLFVLECQNFFHLCRFWGSRERAIQIDHTYMFVPETITALLNAVDGLTVCLPTVEIDEQLTSWNRRRRENEGRPSLHVRLIARASPGIGRNPPPAYRRIKQTWDSLPDQPWRYGVYRPLRAVQRRLDRALLKLRRSTSAA